MNIEGPTSNFERRSRKVPRVGFSTLDDQRSGSRTAQEQPAGEPARYGRIAPFPPSDFDVGRWTLDVGRSKRTAFTLVEMLVSVGLVILMMLMFTQIFQLATDQMGTQRGIAQNDQRSRTLTTIIKNDLDNRTFRILIHEMPSSPHQARRFPVMHGYLRSIQYP